MRLNIAKSSVVYGCILTVAAFGWFELQQTHVTAPASNTPIASMKGLALHSGLPLARTLLALSVVIVAARVFGYLARYLQQPPVVGEMVAGILLGPSLLGRVAPEATLALFPPVVLPNLGLLSQIGIVLYMFLVGLELDTALLKKQAHVTVAISHASIIIPFSLGAASALWLYPILSSSDVPFPIFALFIGISMSVTAFPVLARILADLGLQRSELGVLAISCAAVDDVSAWCLLAFVTGAAQASLRAAVLSGALTVLYIGVVVLFLRPLIERALRRHASRQIVPQGSVWLALVALLLSACVTESIGIHAAFGAFLLGAVIPHQSALAKSLHAKLSDLVCMLLLPAFFALTGLRTQIGLISGTDNWLICALLIFIACLGKFGGSMLTARFTGVDWRNAAGLGVLMNTRGLMELIVLNIGLDMGVISPTLFAMLVLMALVTTLATSPVLSFVMATRSSLAVEPELNTSE